MSRRRRRKPSNALREAHEDWHAHVSSCRQCQRARTGQELLALKGHTDAVSSVSFSPDGTRLASASFDRKT